MKQLRINLLNRAIFSLMEEIENESGLMFHEYNQSLERRCMDVMASKNAALLNMLIKDLELIVQGFSK